MTVTGFAAFRPKPKVVDLAALTLFPCDAWLALTLASADVTLAIGGTQSMAVTPLTALPTLQVVESRVTGPTVPATHMRETFTLPGHGVTATLLPHGPIGIATASFAFVGWVESQRISKKSIFAPVTIEASGVVDALEALSRQAVAVPHSVGVDVAIALA